MRECALAVAASFADCHAAFLKARWKVYRYEFVSPDANVVVRYVVTRAQMFGVDHGSTVFCIPGFHTSLEAVDAVGLAQRRGLVLVEFAGTTPRVSP